MKMKKLTSIALAAALAIGTFGFSVPAKAADNSTDYVLTIPATLNVENAGWNVTDGITANNSANNFATNKKLTVTAESTNGWKLKADNVTDTVGYNLATTTGPYNVNADPASWEFSATELNEASGTTKPMGIIVQDYSNNPAGTYEDTVTFTAKVESVTKTITWDYPEITSISIVAGSGEATFENITVTANGSYVYWTGANRIELSDNQSLKFTSSAGKISKIVITAGTIEGSVSDWTQGSTAYGRKTLTWSSDTASQSVTLKASSSLQISSVDKIEFTVEQ